MHQKLFKNSSLTLLWSHKESYLQLLKKGLLTKNRLYLQNLEMSLWNKEAAPNWEKVVKFSVKRQMYCSKTKKVNKMIVVWVVSKVILYKSRLELSLSKVGWFQKVLVGFYISKNINRPKSPILFHKDISPSDLYKITLVVRSPSFSSLLFIAK